MDTPYLNLWKRLRLRLLGRVCIGNYRKPGWSGTLPFYAFTCPNHGVVVDYPHGYNGRLDCQNKDYAFYLKGIPL